MHASEQDRNRMFRLYGNVRTNRVTWEIDMDVATGDVLTARVCVGRHNADGLWAMAEHYRILIDMYGRTHREAMASVHRLHVMMDNAA